jgi:hypothetical protein
MPHDLRSEGPKCFYARAFDIQMPVSQFRLRWNISRRSATSETGMTKISRNKSAHGEALAVWMNSCASLERILQFLFWFFAISRFSMGKPDGCYQRGQEEGKDRNESLDPNKAVGY